MMIVKIFISQTEHYHHIIIFYVVMVYNEIYFINDLHGVIAIVKYIIYFYVYTTSQRVCRVWSGYPAVLFQNDLVFHISYSLRKKQIPTKIISTPAQIYFFFAIMDII